VGAESRDLVPSEFADRRDGAGDHRADGLLFLLAWEIMALAPFFLVIFDDRRASVRHAAWTYLAATHLGTAFSWFCSFWLAGWPELGFLGLRRGPERPTGAVVPGVPVGADRFRVEGRIVPAHVWLPEAHPVAPSHASALMSGAMIKVRDLWPCPHPHDARTAADLVGLAADCRRRVERRARRAVRPRAARPEAFSWPITASRTSGSSLSGIGLACLAWPKE